jgi:hypothetical protein
LNQFENHANYNCEITLDNGDQYLVFGNWIHNQELDNWQAWSCSAGYTRFYIDKNFDVWSGECKNDYLGNVLESWATKSNAVCARVRCTGCTDDLITEKHKNA